MLVPDNIFDSISDIVERSYNGFIYNILGDDFLSDEQRLMMESLGLLTRRKTLLELLYILVRQRSEERYQSRRELNELLQEVFDSSFFDNLPESQRMTISNASRSIDTIIKEVKLDITKKVNKEIIKVNKEVSATSEVNEFGLLVPLPLSTKKKEVSNIMVAIGAGLLASNELFHKKFTTELTDFVNKAVVDKGKDSKEGLESLAYKKVVNDTHLCQWCHGSYVDEEGSPKIYKLKELLKNGSNDGKPKHQWKPVVGPHHPRCRCQLILTKKST